MTLVGSHERFAMRRHDQLRSTGRRRPVFKRLDDLLHRNGMQARFGFVDKKRDVTLPVFDEHNGQVKHPARARRFL